MTTPLIIGIVDYLYTLNAVFRDCGHMLVD
jgi:hypothetical protein